MNKLWQSAEAIKPSPKATSLMLASVLFFFTGISNILVAGKLDPTSDQYKGLRAHFALVHGLTFWGILFCTVGTLAVLLALVKQTRLGFLVLSLMAAFWAVLGMTSLIMTGYVRSIPGLFIWASIAGFMFMVSSWPESGRE